MIGRAAVAGVVAGAILACAAPPPPRPAVPYQTPVIASPSPVITAEPYTVTAPTEIRPEDTPEPVVAAASTAAVSQVGGGLEAIYEAAAVPIEWRADLAAIAWCESRWRAGAIGDGGASLGLHQLWGGWFRPDEDPLDPVTNSRVAARVREIRGRFGGAGGWTCADRLGIW